MKIYNTPDKEKRRFASLEERKSKNVRVCADPPYTILSTLEMQGPRIEY